MPGDALQHSTGISDARLPKRIGVRISEARKIRGMKLRTLADACGCSESLISKIENGKAHPSLQILNRIVDALNVSMGWVFDGLDDEPPAVARTRKSPPVHSCNRSVTAKQLLAADVATTLQCHLLNIEVGAESEPFQLRKGEEVSYLLEGSIELTVNGRLHRLSTGDVFALKVDQSYRFRNVGSGPVSMLLVGTRSIVRDIRLFSGETRRARPWIFAAPRSEMAFREGAQSRAEQLDPGFENCEQA